MVLTTACSNYASQSKGTAAEADDSSPLDTATPTAEESEVEPDYWSLDGDIEVTEAGELELDTSLLSVRLWDGTSELCAIQAEIATSEAATSPDAAAIQGWWQLTLEDITEGDTGDTACSDWGWQSKLQLGIGDLDAQLTPALISHGLIEQAEELHGLYIAYTPGDGDNDSFFVFGIADHEGDTASTEILEGGKYTITSLHLLPL